MILSMLFGAASMLSLVSLVVWAGEQGKILKYLYERYMRTVTRQAGYIKRIIAAIIRAGIVLVVGFGITGELIKKSQDVKYEIGTNMFGEVNQFWAWAIVIGVLVAMWLHSIAIAKRYE